MACINNAFMALRLRFGSNRVDSHSLAMLFCGEVRQINGNVITEGPTFGVAHRTSVPISRGDPPTP